MKMVVPQPLAFALAASSIALASPALADDPPPVPVTPGQHTLTITSNGHAFAVTVALDCGPACFSMTHETTRNEYQWMGDKWLDPSQGLWTADGITFTNRNGRTAIMS
ncbi:MULTISPECIES: hypothetical protein [Mycobacterium]|uniref:Uncharacterized protein n=1 Tax=Mycobacterium kiyosense TaxID=2871094 RepID=A0A9P3UYW1_9MYCO|nr:MULTISPECIES: hypothetical protein [Mycobacterium]BDB44450.1 hypothetical protein IWGMT90018_48960 [Mycobacterium kiyosense]BDE15966.1 hypothetical protein MKCMC460_48260 [Mycobacterium sp. 20KCMC460]GLB81800.1 hypothetical protein SRL2020028_10560 [Mycobacterium kiyosense]GLB90336.1 hypothetical protein SRL2020130_31530 [Mycobacterium kiyosense]GLB96075.1 hypothetical protein SRL2020226_28510 [Mycobacterium kiyosense]